MCELCENSQELINNWFSFEAGFGMELDAFVKLHYNADRQQITVEYGIVDGDSAFTANLEINYCPLCGRSLKATQKELRSEILKGEILQPLNDIGSVNLVEVVRCKECKYCCNPDWYEEGFGECTHTLCGVKLNDFCSRGEKGEPTKRDSLSDDEYSHWEDDEETVLEEKRKAK